ncbi:ATP-binding protein, partial [Moorena sp. SIO2C4]
FDLLIQQNISATILVKPQGEGWHREIKRYQQQVDLPKTIYLCHCLGDDWKNGVNLNRDSQLFSLPLETETQLQQEYFLLILGENYSSLIVACQPDLSESDNLTDSELSQPLLAVFTLEQSVIRQFLQGLSTVIGSNTADQLSHWETLLAPPETLNSTLLTQLLLKQVQRTEEIVQNTLATQPIGETNPSPPSPPAVPESVVVGKNSLSKVEPYMSDEILQRVAQELRTPITNMKTALKLLDASQMKLAQRQRYIGLLYKECDRLNSLVAGLLELVQLEGDPQTDQTLPLKLADIVPGIVSTYQPLAQEKGIQLGYTIPANLPSVLFSEVGLRHIVINLLHNSLKFTPAGGKVRVQGTRKGKYVQLIFSDTGIGIAESDIPKIFDSFYRGRSTPREDLGAGIGLTIVQQLLQRGGGSIAVVSRFGQGSQFKVLLPIASET